VGHLPKRNIRRTCFIKSLDAATFNTKVMPK
jgi:hypothetical protein